MAEAILFGHRALQPLIDLQEELQKARRQGQAHPVPRAGHRVGPRLRRQRSRPSDEFVVVDVETTGRDPKMADLVEIARRPDQGRQDRRPLVDPRQPGPLDRRPPDARHHRQGRQGRPDAQGGRRDSSSRSPARRPSSATTSASTSASSRRPWATASASRRAATSTRSCSPARATRLQPRATSSATSPGSSASSSPPTIAPCRTPRRPPQLLLGLRRRPAEPDRDPRTTASPARSAPTRTGGRRRRASSRRPAARRGSARACSGSSTRRPSASSSSTRASGWTAAASTRSARSRVEVGLLPRAHGSGLFTRGETQALTVATLGAVLGRPADRHDQPGDREALPPPLQHAAVQHRREQADARPRPARDRPRPPGRAGAPAGPAEPRRSSPTSSGSCRSASRRTARRRWPRPAARRSPSWTPACRSRRRSPARRWA